MSNPARQLPEGVGYTYSGWWQLDEMGRESLLEMVLEMEPFYSVVGVVDYTSLREPVLTHSTTGEFMSLAGQAINFDSLALDLTITKEVIPLWAYLAGFVFMVAIAVS